MRVPVVALGVVAAVGLIGYSLYSTRPTAVSTTPPKAPVTVVALTPTPAPVQPSAPPVGATPVAPTVPSTPSAPVAAPAVTDGSVAPPVALNGTPSIPASPLAPPTSTPAAPARPTSTSSGPTTTNAPGAATIPNATPPEPNPAPATPPVSAPALPIYQLEGGYSVQIAAYRTDTFALRLQARLRAAGFSSVSVDQSGEYYRVRSGPYADQNAARAEAAKIAIALQP